MPRLIGVKERRYQHFWDSFDESDFRSENWSYFRLFGGKNIGYQNKCNLQVAGQLASDQSAWIYSWWITTPLTQDHHQFMRETVITMNVGDRPFQSMKGDMLYHQTAVRAVIPVRQNFQVEVVPSEETLWPGGRAYVFLECQQTRDVC